ncbi:MAG: NnrS family protein [Casimicrobiaceae bacterium]
MPGKLDLKRSAGDCVPVHALALWHLGFRPFYLMAAIFGSLSIALWGAQYAGWLTTPYLRGPIWHAHEMVFGFTLAVMTGFLFTAVRNWTSRPTPTGAALAALALLWLGGRVLVLTPFGVAAACVNVAFPIAVAVGIGRALVGSGNRHNLFFVGLLLMMAAAALATHLAQLGIAELPDWLGLRAALDIILLVMTVLGGRVIPMFTANGVPGARVRRNALVEHVVPMSAAAVLVCDVIAAPATLVAVVLVVGAGAQAIRVLLWRPWQTWRVPLVWILHVGYGWIPLHLALRALSEFDRVASPIATHALTVGAIGALTLGMMTRTARGHTGRPLHADRWDVAAFAMVTGAAVIRVALPLVLPDLYAVAVVASALSWSAAYAIYAVRYWPVLTSPRVDGKPG